MRKHRTADYNRVSIDAAAGEVVPRSSQASQIESMNKNAMAPRLSKPKLVKKSPEPRIRQKESAKHAARINKLQSIRKISNGRRSLEADGNGKLDTSPGESPVGT